MAKTQQVVREQEADMVAVDYPQEMEIISSPFYTLRVAADQVERVEVSIDDSDWQPCRQSSGYWWFDWSGYPLGRHVVVARAWTKDGKVLKSKARRCKVYLASTNN